MNIRSVIIINSTPSTPVITVNSQTSLQKRNCKIGYLLQAKEQS